MNEKLFANAEESIDNLIIEMWEACSERYS